MLFGGRAAGMGGTYIAISDDTAGCFYNPAGTVYAYEDSISGSGNAFFSQKYRIDEISNPLTEETMAYERQGESFLANFIGILKKNDNFTYCFIYLTPETNSEHQFSKFKQDIFTYELDWNLEDSTYLSGSSIASSFTNYFSWGIGLFYHYRTGSYNHTEYMEVDLNADGSNEVFGSFFNRANFKEYGFLYKFGLQWNPSNEIVLGFVFDQLKIHKTDYVKVYSGTTYNWIFAAESLSSGQSISSENSANRLVPFHLGFGLAFYPSQSLIYSIDIDYYSSVESSVPFSFPINYYSSILPFAQVQTTDDEKIISQLSSQPFTLNEIYNYSLGLETYINSENSLTLGFYSNNTSSPDAGESNAFYYDHIDMIGLSGAYSSHTPNSTFTTGLVLTKGEGKLIVNHFLPRKINTYPVSRSSWTLFIAIN